MQEDTSDIIRSVGVSEGAEEKGRGVKMRFWWVLSMGMRFHQLNSVLDV